MILEEMFNRRSLEVAAEIFAADFEASGPIPGGPGR
jgi:hypothetical protein